MEVVKRHKHNRISFEQLILAVFFIIWLLSLSRYLANGEPRTVGSDAAQEETLQLYDGIEITQPITITEEMNWRDGYYALKFADVSGDCEGTVFFQVRQGDEIRQEQVAVSDIVKGEFYAVPLSFDLLKSGRASLSMMTEGVTEGELALACGTDYYGFGETVVDGAAAEYTLAQQYHYHITDGEYTVRIACYLAAVCCCIVLLFFMVKVRSVREETKGGCLAVFGVLTVMFMTVIYIYDSSVIIEPTYAEAVSNFLQYAREESFFSNLLITDAGYLPLFPRLITLFYVKILRIPVEYVLYLMQFTACLCCCMIWSFMTLAPFRKWLCLPERVVFCILIMSSCFYTETVFFTNFVYWGVLLILLFWVSDMGQWNRFEYAIVTFISSLICLSKGTYVIMLPFMLLCFVLFHRGLSVRNKRYAFCLMGASVLQLLYSFSGMGGGSGWIDSGGSMGRISYWLKLPFRICADVTGYLLLFMGSYIGKINKLLPVVTILVCVLLAAGFLCKVLLPLVRKEEVQKKWKAFYALVLFLFASAAFYRITVKSVPSEWKQVFSAAYAPPGGKYQIFCAVAALLIWAVLLSLMGDSKAGQSGIRLLGNHTVDFQVCAVTLFVLLFVFSGKNLQLAGLGSTEVSDRRTYAGDITAGWQQTKGLIRHSAFFVPVREKYWSYCKGVTVYQVGEERYYEESTAAVNLGDMEEGYRSEYTIDGDMPAENIIEIWIHTPNRIATSPCKAVLLDEYGNIIQEAVQFTSTRNAGTGFSFQEPVNGMKTVRFMDENGEEVYIDDYICWITAW